MLFVGFSLTNRVLTSLLKSNKGALGGLKTVVQCEHYNENDIILYNVSINKLSYLENLIEVSGADYNLSFGIRLCWKYISPIVGSNDILVLSSVI